ncbi:MAG TPA: glycosyltransferase [Acidimicrobiales bacterium]|jgi:cellulose synthase/poly-beta-1,6-N-acetylglucosamine synthase-like glycosyltransferase|nr:glycosyltransferase [Acidimicrobiales bacterium]
MLFGFFVVCTVALGLSTLLLALAGRRVRFASRLTGALLSAVVYFAAGWIAAEVWAVSPGPIESAEIFCFGVTLVVIWLCPVWNPIGQLFMGSFVGAALAYLVFAAAITVDGNLSLIGAAASALLFVLEFCALTLASSFAFETCDVLTRTRHSRQFPTPDPTYRPKVSLHIAAYNEPPDMLIETIKRAEALNYPDFEIVVVDNNTLDPDVWHPVEDYCVGRPNVRFVHVEPWPGFKSGALNLALRQFTHPEAEIVGVIDADYLVDPQWLDETVGYFADPNLAFVQTPQDYRDFEGNTYLTACYDAYRYFFATAMPSRNERNSIIFAGTMGLLRKEVLGSIDGWDEWCITEDADTSLRLLRAGHAGLFVNKSYGRGIMPLTFSSLKSQRFRWCFGGMQILRQHWKSLMPWDRSPDNRLSIGQRLDYLIGGLQWLNDLIYLCFTIVLLTIAGLLISGHTVAIRPLIGPTVLLPAALLASGLLRAVWALRHRTGVTYRRALLAFINWLSLSWTVALACVQGLMRREGVFLRTPKTESHDKLSAALLAARAETAILILLWGCDIALGFVAHPTALLLGLLAWQGVVYAAAPLTSYLAQRAQLSPELERRRRSEESRERLPWVRRPVAVSSIVLTGAAACAAVVVLSLGVTNPGHPSNPFSVPQRSGSSGPWGVVPVSNHTTPPTTSTPTSTTTTTTVPTVPTGSTTTTTSNGSSTTTTTTPSSTTSTSSTSTTTSSTSTTTTTTTPTAAAGAGGAGGAAAPGAGGAGG